jgi:hypothetical protein
VFNVDVKEATNALGAALRGESEPARRFGVNISDAAVQAEALALGLVDSTSEITDQIKVQARYSLILKQSEQVAGDFGNTSENLANSTRVLKANLENVAAELGQAFLPLVTDAVAGVRDAVKWFADLDDGTKKLVTTIGIIAASSGPVIGAVGTIGKLKTAIVALNTSAMFGPAGIIAAVVGLSAGMFLLAQRMTRVTRETRNFEEVSEDLGTSQLKSSLEALNRELETGGDAWFNNYTEADRWRDATRGIVNEYGNIDAVLERSITTQQKQALVTAISSRNEDELRSVLEELVLARTEDAEAAEAQASASEAAAEAAAEEERARREQIEATAAAARTEAEQRFSGLLREINGQTELQRIEAARAEELSALADQYIRSGEAVDLLNEYYDTLIEQEKELQEQRAAEKQAEEAERLSKLRLELFGTETEKFEAGLAERVELYREAGLEEEEIARAVAEQRKEFTDQMIADSRREVDERLRVIREGYEQTSEEREEEIEEEEEHQHQLTGIVGFGWDERIAEIQSAYDEAERLRQRDLAKELNAQAKKVDGYEKFASQVSSILGNLNQIKLNLIEEELNRNIDALDKEALGEEAYEEKVTELRQQAAIDAWEAERELFDLRKAANLARIAMDTASAIIRAIAELGPVAGIAAGALIGTLGATQAGLVLSEPAPPKPSFALGGDFITNGPQEILVGDNPGGRERVRVDPISSPGRQDSGGVTVVMNAALNTDSQKNLERAARVLLPYLQREEARRG